MISKPLLLWLCVDPLLLEIRTRVFATRYLVTSLGETGSLEALPDSAYRVLILCHSLPGDDCSRAIHLVRGRWPAIKVLLIETAFSACSEEEADQTIDSLSPAEVLLETVEQLIAEPQIVSDGACRTAWQRLCNTGRRFSRQPGNLQ